MAIANDKLDAKAQSIPLFAEFSSKFTKSDTIIANYIAEHVKKVLQMTISDLSLNTGISEITISRFCKKLDLSGFQDLKVNLASITVQTVDEVELDMGDDTPTLASKIFHNIQTGLNMTDKVLDYQAVDRAANLIANCNRLISFGYGTSGTICRDIGIRFVRFGICTEVVDYQAVDRAANLIANCNRLISFGYGTSGTICRDIGIRFVRFGICTEVVHDPHQQATIADMCELYNTVIVVVSLSGSSVNLIEPVKSAKQNGAKIILITSHKRSPLASLADEVLVGIGPEIRLLAESTVTRFVYLAIVDLLFSKVAIIKNESYHQHIINMRHSLAPLKS